MIEFTVFLLAIGNEEVYLDFSLIIGYFMTFKPRRLNNVMKFSRTCPNVSSI
jgi:hypothetical protein